MPGLGLSGLVYDLSVIRLMFRTVSGTYAYWLEAAKLDLLRWKDAVRV